MIGSGKKLPLEDSDCRKLNIDLKKDNIFFITTHGEIDLERFMVVPKNTFIITTTSLGNVSCGKNKINNIINDCHPTLKETNNQLFGIINREEMDIHQYTEQNTKIIYYPGDIIPISNLYFTSTYDSVGTKDVNGIFKIPIHQCEDPATSINILTKDKFTFYELEELFRTSFRCTTSKVNLELCVDEDKLGYSNYISLLLLNNSLIKNQYFIERKNTLPERIKNIINPYLIEINEIDNLIIKINKYYVDSDLISYFKKIYKFILFLFSKNIVIDYNIINNIDNINMEIMYRDIFLKNPFARYFIPEYKKLFPANTFKSGREIIDNKVISCVNFNIPYNFVKNQSLINDIKLLILKIKALEKYNKCMDEIITLKGILISMIASDNLLNTDFNSKIEMDNNLIINKINEKFIPNTNNNIYFQSSCLVVKDKSDIYLKDNHLNVYDSNLLSNIMNINTLLNNPIFNPKFEPIIGILELKSYFTNNFEYNIADIIYFVEMIKIGIDINHISIKQTKYERSPYDFLLRIYDFFQIDENKFIGIHKIFLKIKNNELINDNEIIELDKIIEVFEKHKEKYKELYEIDTNEKIRENKMMLFSLSMMV